MVTHDLETAYEHLSVGAERQLRAQFRQPLLEGIGIEPACPLREHTRAESGKPVALGRLGDRSSIPEGEMQGDDRQLRCFD